MSAQKKTKMNKIQSKNAKHDEMLEAIELLDRSAKDLSSLIGFLRGKILNERMSLNEGEVNLDKLVHTRDVMH